MIELPEPPRLTVPSTALKTSYLVGEQADMRHRGSDASWLKDASLDFDAYVAERTGVRERWGVASELFWFASGEYYIGSLVIRHELTDDEGGGHIGYHVVYPWQRQGHATRMLREALVKCAGLGIERALLTVAPENAASIEVVRRNGGVEDLLNHEGEMRFWINTVARADAEPS
ncbi:GNAT family N-acetyltransferase [Agreia sp. VKM Ac-1783]|uniref:GNAT family N-acetyltransferase n=1 Tax=Agreia sp. VKM Ac-1783 TaxID=1938889 RepID=UPI000A2ADF43|nr:GNAT family N-acetyltransferase [Agreia sp. VKM Ac-1783]SMQ74964.1 Predicted acetyltransferase [Agreia sp. VKM Ac-1783]